MKSKITLPFWTQPKLDGIRFTSSQEASLSRGGKPFPVVSHIVDALAPAFASFPGLRLDGELYNHKLKEDFNQITSLVKQMKPKKEDFEKAAALVEYHVYDIPSHPGTFSERIHFLEHEVMPHISDKRIVLVETCPVSSIEALDELYGRWLSEGYEGQMIRTDAVYQSGPKRDGRLIKRKEFMDAEYPVIRIESGVGDWTGVAKSVICSNGEREFGAGIKGTVENGRKLLAGPLPKFATVRYPNLTPDGVPRFGIAVEFFNEERTS
jgi:DNA ligase-1